MRTFALGILAVGLLAGGCGSDTEEADQLADLAAFCRGWSVRVCNDGVVAACQAASVESCQARQQAFCNTLFGADPDARYVRGAALPCLDAVGAAYQDARLTQDEVRLVRGDSGLVPPCSLVLTGTGAVGATCASDTDCATGEGLRCVRSTPASMEGECQVPVVRSGGQSCGRPEQTCATGFYCDGQNCLEARGEGENCSDAVPCGDSFLCVEAVCRPRAARGAPCSTPGQCLSRLCVVGAGGGVCVDSVVLSPAEPLCAELR